MNEERARKYLDAIVRMNQKDTSNEIGVSEPTVHKQKKQFDDLSPRERNLLIIRLATKNLDALED